MKRREFIASTAMGATALAATPSWAEALVKEKIPFGIQLFTMPQTVAKDFEGTMKLLGSIGYREVEFFGPYPFSDPETIERWKGIAEKMGIVQNAFYGKTVKEVKSTLEANQLKSPSVHFDLKSLRGEIGPAMEAFASMGVQYVAIPTLNTTVERQTLDDYKRLAEEFSAIGRKMAPYGLTFGYHNHGYEHAEKDGRIPMEILLENTDKKTVAFELDIFWMTAAGADPVDFLSRYPGRFKMLHLKDAAEPVRFTGDGGSSDQWMALFPKMADPGKGVFDIPKIVSQAVKSGVRHFYLEHDLTPDPMKTLKDSWEYWEKLKVQG